MRVLSVGIMNSGTIIDMSMSKRARGSLPTYLKPSTLSCKNERRVWDGLAGGKTIIQVVTVTPTYAAAWIKKLPDAPNTPKRNAAALGPRARVTLIAV